jgi:hypothetical protein
MGIYISVSTRYLAKSEEKMVYILTIVQYSIH